MSIATPESSARWRASASSPSEMSIIDVAPASAAAGPASYGGSRASIGLHQHPRRPETPAEYGQSSRRPALPAGEGEDVADLRPGAYDRPDRAGSENGDRDHDLVRLGEVAADDAGAHQRALVRESLREVQRPRHRQVGRGGEPDGQRGRPPAHRVDVGQVLGGRPVANILGRGPLAAEVPALHHQVGRDDHVTGPDPDYGGVVTGADQDLLALLEEGGEGTDQAELAHVGERCVRGKDMPPSHQMRRAGCSATCLPARQPAR